jgi:CHAT domain-containing protein
LIGDHLLDSLPDTALALREEVQTLDAEIIGLQNALAAERASPNEPDTELIDKLGGNLERARQKWRQLIIQLYLANPDYAALVSMSTIGIEEAQREVLGEQTTLVVYFLTDERTLAWVMDQEHATMVTLPIKPVELEEKVNQLNNGLTGISHEYDRKVAADLYDVLILPLIPSIQSTTLATTLTIVPNGILHYLPFATLWNTEEERYLIEEYALAFAPSASELSGIRALRNPNENRLLALGNPDDTLLDAESEVRAIARVYPGATV